MDKALLYLRESHTIGNGSIQAQETELREYCRQRDIEIIDVITDTCRGTTFDRPGIRKMIDFIGNNRNVCNAVLFTTWSRFSRNKGKLHYMTQYLYKHGIIAEPVIQEPLEGKGSFLDLLGETDIFSVAYNIPVEDMVAFAAVLRLSKLDNGIGGVDSDCITIGVTYNRRDEIHCAFINILDKIQDGDYDPDTIMHAILDIPCAETN